MRKTVLKALALLAIVASPAVAEAAARGYSTANVNMRSGPSTAYPAVVVIPNGARVTIHGCLQDRPWCDVSFDRGRGWVSANYVQAESPRGRYVVEPRRYRELGVPVISFELGRYWDQHYRGRNFYGERERWRRPPPRGGYWDAAPPPPPRGQVAPPPRRDAEQQPPRDPRDPRWESRDNRDVGQERPDRRRDVDRGPQGERRGPPPGPVRNGWPCPPGQDCRMP
jgi:uncharacterized protein YraI